MTNRKIITLVLLLLGVLALMWYVPTNFTSKASNAKSETPASSGRSTRTNLYSNDHVGFDLAYPFDFDVAKNDLGDSLGGVFEADFERNIGTSTESNKLVISILKDSSSPKLQAEQNRNVETKRINKKNYRVEDIYFDDGSRVKNYIVALPSDKDFYLKFSISGTPSNFYFLDDIIQSIKWK